MGAACRVETGEALDDLDVDAAMWFAAVWKWWVDARASGALETGFRLDEHYRWGGPNVPIVETFGRNAEALAAQAALEELFPAAERVDITDEEPGA